MDELAWVDPEAVIRLGGDIARYARAVPEVRHSVARGADAVGEEIRKELGRRIRRLDDTERELRRCDAETEWMVVGELRSRVRAAGLAVDSARSALSAYTAARARLDEASSRWRFDVEASNIEVQQRLADIARDLDVYQRFALATTGHAAGAPSLGRIAVGRVSRAALSSGSTGLSTRQRSSDTPVGFPAGYTMVPIAQIDLSASPVRGPSNFKADTAPSDLEWALVALHDVVLPAMARGKDLEYFRDRDNREGLVGNRSYADTYVGFFTPGEALRFRLEPTGTYSVANGYHRIWAAQRAGLMEIPGQVVS